jgi:uncharacterized glyoxalase superfamily protein PhnB
MVQDVVPMIHVPDVRVTAEWYASIGFTVLETVEDDGEMNWADLGFGGSRVMIGAGGRASGAERREVDLYVTVDDVEAIYRRLAGRVDLVEPVNDTFYGHRIFIIRDLNRFWITFAQILDPAPSPIPTAPHPSGA